MNHGREPFVELKRQLGQFTAPADEKLIQRLADGEVRCLACAHRCRVKPGRDGVCRVRYNENGVLRVPFGYVSGVNCDPIAKKPFYHLLPGSDCVTFGMLGCDLHCGYCQNWTTSQMLRDIRSGGNITVCQPRQIVDMALKNNIRALVSSYNEPLVTAEWSTAIFKLAKEQGIKCAFVSNGNATEEALDYLQPWIDGFKVDLKTFSDRNYRQLGGILENVTQTIRSLKQRGIWVEIVTLVVPGFSDDAEDLKQMAGFIASVDPLMPWHVTAFHPDYQMFEEYRRTTPEDLLKAVEIGRAAGLKYIYSGNLPGQTGDYENTRCHACGAMLIEREGFYVKRQLVKEDGQCPQCGVKIPGVWGFAGGFGDGRVRRMV
jgi:pyruvate formate lyase activating enzyme